MADLSDLLQDIEEALSKLWDRQCARTKLVEPYPVLEIALNDLLPTGYPYFEKWDVDPVIGQMTNAMATPYYQAIWAVRAQFFAEGRFPLTSEQLAELQAIAANAWQLSKTEQFVLNAEQTFLWELQNLADKLRAGTGTPTTKLQNLPTVEFLNPGFFSAGGFVLEGQGQSAPLLSAVAAADFYLTNRLAEVGAKVVALYPNGAPAPIADAIAGVLTKWDANLPTVPAPLPNWLETVINGLVRLTPLVLLPKSLKALAVGVMVKLAERGLQVAIDALIDALFGVLEPQTCKACTCPTDLQRANIGTLDGSGLLTFPVPSGDRQNLRLYFKVEPKNSIPAPYRPKSSGPTDLPRWFQAGFVALTWPGPVAAEEVPLVFGSQVLDTRGATGVRYWIDPQFTVIVQLETGVCG